MQLHHMISGKQGFATVLAYCSKPCSVVVILTPGQSGVAEGGQRHELESKVIALGPEQSRWHPPNKVEVVEKPLGPVLHE